MTQNIPSFLQSPDLSPRVQRQLAKKFKNKSASKSDIKEIALVVSELANLVEAHGFLDAQFDVTFDQEKIPEDLRGKTLVYSTNGAAGFDIASNEDITLHKGETKLVSTSLFITDMSPSYELQIRSRSGLAAKHQVHVLNAPGTIDADYRGEIKIILRNSGQSSHHIHRGDRIAQGVFSRIYRPTGNPAFTFPSPESERGEGGFGSTGQ